jgi:hypothetical protein
MESLVSIIVSASISVSVAGAFGAIWSMIRTRNKYYRDFLRRRSKRDS